MQLVMHNATQQPQMAIASPNTLVCLGLADIIRRMMPMAEVATYNTLTDLQEAEQQHPHMHFFISADILMEDVAYFLQRQRKTIVMVHGTECGHLPQGFNQLNVHQTEKHLLRDFLQLAAMAHGPQGKHPMPPTPQPARTSILTPRETEVLRHIVTGHINKEIAASMNVGLTTIITHRKNITEKLGIKNVSGLTMYAVMHGIVKAEEI